jgi:hypothetical protein
MRSPGGHVDNTDMQCGGLRGFETHELLCKRSPNTDTPLYACVLLVSKCEGELSIVTVNWCSHFTGT